RELNSRTSRVDAIRRPDTAENICITWVKARNLATGADIIYMPSDRTIATLPRRFYPRRLRPRILFSPVIGVGFAESRLRSNFSILFKRTTNFVLVILAAGNARPVRVPKHLYNRGTAS